MTAKSKTKKTAVAKAKLFQPKPVGKKVEKVLGIKEATQAVRSSKTIPDVAKNKVLAALKTKATLEANKVKKVVTITKLRDGNKKAVVTVTKKAVPVKTTKTVKVTVNKKPNAQVKKEAADDVRANISKIMNTVRGSGAPSISSNTADIKNTSHPTKGEVNKILKEQIKESTTVKSNKISINDVISSLANTSTQFNPDPFPNIKLKS
jgi:hypothetical protein